MAKLGDRMRVYMRPPGSPQQLERRRRQAIRLLKAGHTLSAVARALGASVSSVHRWDQAYRAKGPRALRPRKTPGRPPKLSRAQQQALVKLLLQGPLSVGYRTDLWTLKRVTALIRRQFRVRYHPCHVWKLQDALGWSCQKPARRALQGDEAAIAHWKRYRWPHIKNRRAPGRSAGFPR